MIKSSMAVLSAALFGAVLYTGVANAECQIFEHVDFQGKAGVIQNNDWVKFYGENEDNGVMPRDNQDARVFRDASWRNILSSFKTSANCDVLLYTTPDANKYHKRYHGDTPNIGENNDKSASVLCQCK